MLEYYLGKLGTLSLSGLKTKDQALAFWPQWVTVCAKQRSVGSTRVYGLCRAPFKDGIPRSLERI